MSYFKIFKISDSIYQIKDPMGVLSTLVIGRKLSLLVDTTYGIGDLASCVKSLTNNPLIVVNSHGHMDHTGGNYQFEKVFISEQDIPLCKMHNSSLWRKNNLSTAIKLNILPNDFNQEKYLSMNEGNLLPLLEGFVFDLGDKTIKVVALEGHTLGSLGFLILEDKILITSDAICPFVWLFLDESTTLDTYIKMLKRTLLLPFDYILVGHGNGELLIKNRVLEFLKVAIQATVEDGVRVSFNNFENLNSYCYTPYTMYDQSKAGIVFNPLRRK